MQHPIPDEALDDRHAFVGTSGSGKTYGAGTAVERILARKGRVIIPDPLGVWWGLRLKADGKTPSGHNVVIFGGDHADLPINEHAGALIGETAATMAESCIIDLSGFTTKAAERRFMLAFLEALYRKASGEPVHLIFDEADLWAPQKALEPQLQSKMEQIVRRGRVKGFIPWLITQRPAVLSKDVLSQADGMIAFKLTSSHDRAAIGAWIEGQADKAREKEILSQLAGMQKGEAVVWIPARNILVNAVFPRKQTFDSSRTPKRGEVVNKAVLQPIDLGALKTRLAKVEAEVRENDPKALKAEIARLTKEAKNIPQNIPAPDHGAIDAAEKRGYAAGFFEGKKATVDAIFSGADSIAHDVGNVFTDTVRRMAALVNVPTVPKELIPQTRSVSTSTPKSPPRVNRITGYGSAGALNSAGQKMLAVLDTNPPVKRSWTQVATLAGLKARGGHFNEGRKGLIESGLIVQEGGLIRIAQPSANAGNFHHDPEELVEIWSRNLSGAAPKILRHMASFGPSTRQQIAEVLGMQPRGGHWNDAWKQLRDNEIVRMNGDTVQLTELFT